MDAKAEYLQHLGESERRIDHLDNLLNRMVWVRTVCFAIGSAAFLYGYLGEVGTAWTIRIGWLFALAFLVAIIVNEHLRLMRLSAENDLDLFKRLIARMDRQWQALPIQIFESSVQAPPFSDDLDIAGQSSLLSLLSLAGTQPGRHVLQSWIASVPDWDDVTVRQRAVQALVPERSLRLEVIRRVSLTGFGNKKAYGLIEWAESDSWLDSHPFARLMSYVGPALLLLGGAILFIGLQSNSNWLANIGYTGLAAGTILNILITLLWGGWIQDVFHRVSGEHHATRQFSQVFTLLGKLPEDGGLLDEARRTCTQRSDGATAGLAQLNRLVRLASMQQNVLLYILYLGLQLVLLWDFRVLKSLERWKGQFGPSVREWFDALGRCEALISAATLADENPTWCFPQASLDNQNLLDARKLGHPLLPTSSSVANDVQITRTSPLLLVTGSNMAGKSTFIRSIGLNVLLSRVGGPVCAEHFAAPMFELASSIRIRDSLRDGVSFFMAELKRLKSVVDLAGRHQADGQPPLMFLLDEVLQGTNSRERQIAVSGVVQQLIQLGATGVLSTHDLDLAKVDQVARVAQLVHFREYFQRDASGTQVMHFDYIMRPGSTPTTNALKLLEIVGLSPGNSANP